MDSIPDRKKKDDAKERAENERYVAKRAGEKFPHGLTVTYGDNGRHTVTIQELGIDDVVRVINAVRLHDICKAR